MRKQLLPFSEFKSIYSRVPRLTVDLVIMDAKGLVLTLRQHHGWIGQWHLPGGTVYMYESLNYTIARIAKEELGIEVKIVKNLGCIEYHSEKKERGFGYSISVVFECVPVSSDYRLDNQVSKLDFFKKLPENLIDEQKKFLEGIIKL